MHLNLFALLYLASSIALFLLFRELSKDGPFNPARTNYNYVVFFASLWMLADFVEYSATTPEVAEYGLILSSFFISISLFFLVKVILELEGRVSKVMPVIPLASFALLSPLFEVTSSKFVPFNDKPNLALILFNVIELVFMLYFICSLHSLSLKVTKKKLKAKLEAIRNSLFFITIFTFSYYFISIYFSLPPLTWVSAFIFVGVTFKVFKS